MQKFLKGEKNIVSRSQIAVKESGSSVSNMSNGKDKMLPSFWIPSKTPEAKETILQKPDKTIYCPLSGKPLKIKDLIPVKFTEVKDPDDKKSLIVKQARYMCPITHDILSNSVPCAVIRTTYDFFHFLMFFVLHYLLHIGHKQIFYDLFSGDVVTMECVEKIIRKDWINPLDSTKLTEADIIPLQRVIVKNSRKNKQSRRITLTFFQGGTGYSAVNDGLEGKHERPVLQA